MADSDFDPDNPATLISAIGVMEVGLDFGSLSATGTADSFYNTVSGSSAPGTLVLVDGTIQELSPGTPNGFVNGGLVGEIQFDQADVTFDLDNGGFIFEGATGEALAGVFVGSATTAGGTVLTDPIAAVQVVRD